MALDYRDIVVIVQLVAYVPAFLVALLVAARHGFGRSSGWVFFVLFALVRIVGSCAFLATLTNQSVTVYIVAAICDSIALSPLIMATVGLLSRVYFSVINCRRTQLDVGR
jgi:Zn-dependent protease with chaperone function